MKTFCVILAAFGALCVAQANKTAHIRWTNNLPPPPQPHKKALAPQLKTMLQKVDNFDASNTDQYKMRYYSNLQFFKTDGPIFIMLGGESNISPGWLQAGQLFDMAQQNGAAMFFTEHRYYGLSQPKSSLTTENLKYLSAPQALADNANFINTLKKDSKFAKSKVVVFGCSYPGNLAMWMREKYPNMVVAAVSSSAPLKAQEDFKEYMEFVKKALNNDSCYSVIKNGMETTQKYLAAGPTGVDKVKKDFNLCSAVNVNDFYDKAYFNYGVGLSFGGMVQYASASQLTDTCKNLMNTSLPDDYSRLASYIKNQRPSCIGNYKGYIWYYSNTTIDENNNDRQWLYQTCNELGFMQTSDGTEQPFGQTFPLKWFDKVCQDLFGSQFGAARIKAGVAATNKNFGALNPDVTRVVSTHGSLDPWSALGLKKNLNAEAPVYYIPNVAHCTDVYSISASDNAGAKKAKLAQQTLIKKWLNS